MYFEYGGAEIAYLKRKDKRLARAIDAIGHIEREVQSDLFGALARQIVAQQISTAAAKTVWQRMADGLGAVTPQTIGACPADALQAFGMTHKKAGYLKGAAARVLDGTLDLDGLRQMSDDEVCKALVTLPGIGVWTAEMLLLFCLQRPDVLSWGDLAIRRGLQRLYHHKELTKAQFERYRRRYSPHGSVASLYLWAIAGGAPTGEEQ